MSEPIYATEVSVIPIEMVMQAWIKHYTFPEGVDPLSIKWYYDQAKGQVAFVIITKTE